MTKTKNAILAVVAAAIIIATVEVIISQERRTGVDPDTFTGENLQMEVSWRAPFPMTLDSWKIIRK